MNLYKKWIQHLKQNNMTYFEHMIFAITYGGWDMHQNINNGYTHINDILS